MLRRLLPGAVEGQAEQVVDALGVTLDRPRQFARGVLSESTPATADGTIDQWLELLGLTAPAGATLGDKRKAAASALASIGGQSLDYINARIADVFPDVYVQEPDPLGAFTYEVKGFYPFSLSFFQLSSIIGRIAPLHLSPVWQVRSVYDGDVARCGIGTAGRKIVGRTTTAYTATQGELGTVSQARVGMEITGRTA
jgi:hypothetical protein